jgi:hemoglobin-like flavoprotein
MNDKTSPQYLAADKAFNKSMSSLVDAIKPNVVIDAIPLVNAQLIENIFALPKVKIALSPPEILEKMEQRTKEIQEELHNIITDPEKIKEFGKDGPSALATALLELENSFPQQEKPSPAIKNSSISSKNINIKGEQNPLLKQVVELIHNLAKEENSKKLGEAFKANSTTIEVALNKLIEQPVAGKVLRDFY